jgi:hypothetical protein
MPYIIHSSRLKYTKQIDQIVSELSNASQDSLPGEVVYVLYQILGQLVAQNKDKVNFAYLNSLVGATENTKLEFVKRILGPYEDNKITCEWIKQG